MQYKLYILRYPKSEALSVFSIIMDINFGFVSLSFSLALLLYFPGVVIMRSYQKIQLEKLVIFCGNISSKEVFNTVHKPKLLSLKGLKRVRN